MIIEYHRPKSIPEALSLISRKDPPSYPLGGGTYLNRWSDRDYAVVDLQELGLNTIANKGNVLEIGARVTLHNLSDTMDLPEEFYKVIDHEATYNLRQMATIAGTLVTTGGRSVFGTAMLALDAIMEVRTQGEPKKQMKYGDFLPMREHSVHGTLITMVVLPLRINFAFESISRTPADLPIVCAAVAKWESGRTRLALGGWGNYPTLAMDGPVSDGIDIAGRNAFSHAGDEWASAEYRQEMAEVLALRCLQRITQG